MEFLASNLDTAHKEVSISSLAARELTQDEIAQVSGAASYTGITDIRIDDDGYARITHGDYHW